MKRFVYIFIFFLCFMFINTIDVDAVSLDMKDVTLECIYSDGGLYTSEYSEGLTDNDKEDSFVINRKSYNLKGVSDNESNKGSGSLIIGPMANGNKCQNKLYYARTGEEDGVSFYKFGSEFLLTDFSGDVKVGWDLVYSPFWEIWENNQKLNNILKTMENYNLVSERYILGSNMPDPNAVVYYMQPATQAAGINSYISILIYDNVILMKKDDRVTRLEGQYNLFKGITRNDSDELSKKVPEKIFINSPEPQQSSDSSSTVSYSFMKNQYVYSVSTDRDSKHLNEYIPTDKIEEGELNNGNALCDEILKETSPILRNVIKGIQILVPVFLIVLTALDIGKIVIAGNIDEELPKRRKIIITRLIIVIAFFFLPVLVRMIVDMLVNSGASNTGGIEYIDCLFR